MLKNMKIILTAFIMFTTTSLLLAQEKEYHLVIGTYTNPSKTNGIHVYQFNTESGEFNSRLKVVDIPNPSYLAISSDNKYLYAVSEQGEGNGAVYAYAFNDETGALQFLNKVASGGDHPCYVSVDKARKVVFVGNYSTGTLSAIPVKADGSLSENMQTIQHEGKSVNKDRQEKPHVHAVVISPDQKYLYVPDLGTDKINVYNIDTAKPQPLQPASLPFVPTKAGSGPRHLTFHPNGKFGFVVTELDAAVTSMDYNNGKLLPRQTMTMLSKNFEGSVGAADIHVSPDGNFLYASNRGDANDIVIYSIDAKGKLTFAGRQSTLGKAPRNFAIDPSGNFLLAANQNTNDIIIFKRDKKTGFLTDTGKKISIDKPVCLKFVEVRH